MQDQLAQRLQYSQTNGLLRSEAFMKDYYEHTRNIFRITERITEQFVRGQSSECCGRCSSFLPKPRSKEEDLGEFVSREEQLHAKDANLFRENPTLMMRAFQLVQEKNLELSPELEDLFARSLSLITRTFQYAKEPRDIFKAMLTRKGRSRLRSAHDASGRFSRSLHSGIRRSHLSGAARVFSSLHRR